MASTAPATDDAPEGMVAIPPGIFLMGETGMNPEEQPAHEAIVAKLYLDKTEVTVDAYLKCEAAGACTKTRNALFCNEYMEGRGKHPINCIDLNQASAYCGWAGKRLPTEREWEYAARNGSERRRFSWGNADPTEKNSCYHHPFGSCPVASFEPGAFGLYDVSGNVWEWTQSEFLPYPSRAAVDPIDPKKLYVYRGGSWSRRFPKWLRNALRNRYQPHEISGSIGMRCAKSVTPLTCPAESSDSNGACVRSSGTPLCDAGKVWVASSPGDPQKGCQYDPHYKPPQGGPLPTKPTSAGTEGDDSAPVAHDSSGAAVINRIRTPQHDPDCQHNWPKTPASYLFQGGENYPSRKPAVSGAGCVPRDMSWKWTSA